MVTSILQPLPHAAYDASKLSASRNPHVVRRLVGIDLSPQAKPASSNALVSGGLSVIGTAHPSVLYRLSINMPNTETGHLRCLKKAIWQCCKGYLAML